jgi:hypothetical protein
LAAGITQTTSALCFSPGEPRGMAYFSGRGSALIKLAHNQKKPTKENRAANMPSLGWSAKKNR